MPIRCACVPTALYERIRHAPEAGPGAKAYAKGSCVDAYNNSYARAEAEGSVVQNRDSGRDGSYASAIKYGNWSCSSYGAASAYITVAGFTETISSDSDAYSGCN